jgi:hypothetical protein
MRSLRIATLPAVARAKADISNTALRIFLQELGAAYDQERGLQAWNARTHFPTVKQFFGGRCCYCGAEFGPGAPANQDHLIPMNKVDLGLHAWGNIVPACAPCNNARQRTDWRDYIIERAKADAHERHSRVQEFLSEYRYQPAFQLRDVAEELYEEVGEIAMTLINAKMKRLRTRLKA